MHQLISITISMASNLTKIVRNCVHEDLPLIREAMSSCIEELNTLPVEDELSCSAVNFICLFRRSRKPGITSLIKHTRERYNSRLISVNNCFYLGSNFSIMNLVYKLDSAIKKAAFIDALPVSCSVISVFVSPTVSH
jgi:hypothetical protein